MYLFTSEVVSPGHPDKCADIIADAIVDFILQKDKNARVATEVFLAGHNIIIGGEINSQVSIGNSEYKAIALKTLRQIGYTGQTGFNNKQQLHPDDCVIQVFVNQQSPDIAQGVDLNDSELGAGDQGMMFGYANSETEHLMPAALTYARKIMEVVYHYALNNSDKFGVDVKTQVTLDYKSKENFELGKPQSIKAIVVSVPATSKVSKAYIKEVITNLIKDCGIPESLIDWSVLELMINPTGSYINHSSLHDSGLTGRKLIVDSFGGYAPIGGGAQSSKDYTKVDRSGLYAARWLAKHIVASGLAQKVTVQLAYVIGRSEPISVNVNTLGTSKSKLSDEEFGSFLLEKFELTPRWIVDKFNLDKPGKGGFLYSDIAARGQVGQPDYPWEKLDGITLFKQLALSK